MKQRFLAIINPAAGAGRCGRMADAVLARVRDMGIDLETARTSRAGEATEIARAAYSRGIRNFLAAGGDGTSFEIVNGLFPEALPKGKSPERVALGFLPLGTGNSFLRDFTDRGVEYTLEAMKEGRRRGCDAIRLRHAGGELYYINLFSLGFPADVAETTNRSFKGWGEHGYILGVLTRLAGLKHRAFPHRLDGAGDWNREPALFLVFSNSKFTGGKMMIAPKADPSDGKIEYVRWGRIGRAQLLWIFPRLFTGTHIEHARAFRAPAERVDFELSEPSTVMIDGEILHLQCESLEIVPSALDVIA